MADDIAVAVVEHVEEVKQSVEDVLTWKDKVCAWFKHSLTIAWARAQYVVGVLGAGLIAAFSGYDFTQLAAMDARDVFKMLGAVAVAGVLTEISRRRTL